MTKKQFFLLLIPSLLWGSSFIFMRHLSPVFGPIPTTTIRVIVAAFALFIFITLKGEKIPFKENILLFVVIGLLNSAVPFTLYAFAALHIPSSLSVILNSTAPMFGAVFGVLLLRERVSLLTIIGIFLGTIGVGLVSSEILLESELVQILSILACVLAAAFYGLTGTLIRKYSKGLKPTHLTAGSLVFAALGMIVVNIVLALFGINPTINSTNMLLDIGIIIVFGIFCTSIPYIVYYRLVQEVGPVKALMVTYLMPVFGILFGLLDGDNITILMILGFVVIVTGIYSISYRKTHN